MEIPLAARSVSSSRNHSLLTSGFSFDIQAARRNVFLNDYRCFVSFATKSGSLRPRINKSITHSRKCGNTNINKAGYAQADRESFPVISQPEIRLSINELAEIRQQRKTEVENVTEKAEIEIEQKIVETLEINVPGSEKIENGKATQETHVPSSVHKRASYSEIQKNAPHQSHKLSGVVYKAPMAKRINVPVAWGPEVEDLFRFQEAGYLNELHHWIVQRTEVLRWPVSGFVRSLWTKRGNQIKFSPSRLCDNHKLHQVRIYDYDLKFLRRDAAQIALLQMRLAAVQQQAKKAAEDERIKLIKQTQKRSKHKDQKSAKKKKPKHHEKPQSENPS